MKNELNLDELNSKLETLSPQEVLAYVYERFPGEKALALSMQIEGLVVLDMLLKQDLETCFYTIDTGRLPHETYQLMDTVRFKYDIPLSVFYPDHKALETLVSQKGLFSFKESFENRRECCFLRKVEPNRRALKDKSVWITGLRKEQSEDRNNLKMISYNEDLKIFKLCPLANSTKDFITSYAKENKVPFHPLYSKGYASIGCAPCTRPIQPGAGERSGRWWWENGVKECGLHA